MYVHVDPRARNETTAGVTTTKVLVRREMQSHAQPVQFANPPTPTNQRASTKRRLKKENKGRRTLVDGEQGEDQATQSHGEDGFSF